MQLTASIQLTDQGQVFLFDEFLEADVARRLLTVCCATQHWQVREEYSHWPGRVVYAGQDTVLEEVRLYAQSPTVVAALTELAGAELTFYGADLWQDQQGYRIHPHQDYMDQDRFCHVQIYLADHCDLALGTAFYSSNNAADSLFQIPYRHNSGYFMVTGQDIWHGLPPIARVVNRYSVQLRYRLV